MSPDSPTIDRRAVLKKTTGAAAVLTIGSVATSGTALAGRRGGRGLVDGNVRLDLPFEVEKQGTESLGASCMSNNSAEQEYHVYEVAYCPPDSNTCIMYVHPNEAEVDTDEQYMFRSKKECKANDLVKAAFGPSNEECSDTTAPRT